MLNLLTPRLIGLFGAFLCGCLLAGYVVGGMKDADLYRLKSDHAKAQAKAESEARQRLEEAMHRGDKLAGQLVVTESALNKKTLEVSREVARLTTGRNCLDGAAVRLLNSPRDSGGTVPEAPIQSDAEDGAFASDSDVAGWIANAQGQYETCRARLGSLIDYWEPATP